MDRAGSKLLALLLLELHLKKGKNEINFNIHNFRFVFQDKKNKIIFKKDDLRELYNKLKFSIFYLDDSSKGTLGNKEIIITCNRRLRKKTLLEIEKMLQEYRKNPILYQFEKNGYFIKN